MTTQRITRHSVSACIDLLPSGVLVVKFCGPLTVAALLHVKAEIVAAPYAALIRGFVADYSRAALALDGADLDSTLEGEPDDSAPTMPAALIVSQANAAVFYGHASRMAGHGVMRMVFTLIEPAMTWAHRQAARRSQPS